MDDKTSFLMFAETGELVGFVFTESEAIAREREMPTLYHEKCELAYDLRTNSLLIPYVKTK